MKLMRIWKQVIAEPWLITPSMHKVIADIVKAHIDGTAHLQESLEDLFTEQTPIMEIENGIAVINCIGIIGKGLSKIEKACGCVDTNDLEDAIEQALTNQEVRGILLYVNSCGGTVTGTPELADIVRLASRQKPLIAYTDDAMNSAAYYISAGATAVYGASSASLGSIGCYMAILDSTVAYEMVGLKQEVIKDGTYKAAGLDGTSLTDEQRQNFQDEVDAISARFKSFVSGERVGVKPETMQGQSFYGFQAIGNGLLDRVCSMDEAKQDLMAMADMGILGINRT